MPRPRLLGHRNRTPKRKHPHGAQPFSFRLTYCKVSGRMNAVGLYIVQSDVPKIPAAKSKSRWRELRFLATWKLQRCQGAARHLRTRWRLAMLSPTATLVLTTVACTMSYAMVFPTLAPLLASLEHINSDDSSRWLGVAVSVFSAVKVFAAPPVGALTQRVGWRPTLVCLILFLIAGNAWYALAPTVASVIVARGLVGISGCSSTVCRTAARHGSSKQDRERDAALLSSASTFGFIAGPGLGGLCSLAPSVPWLRLRAPGCIGCGLGD